MSLTNIMGKSKLTKKQLLGYFNNKTKSREYKLTCTIEELIDYYLIEGEIENVRGDIAFIQACLETGFFKYGGIVKWNQNNFCGLGALDGNAQGRCATFESARIGVRAQIQHLKAYASSESLVQQQVDPRFKYVHRCAAIYVEYLGIPDNPSNVGWASKKGYGKLIIDMLAEAALIQDNNKKDITQNKPHITELSESTKYKLTVNGFDCGEAILNDGKMTISVDQIEDKLNMNLHIDSINKTIDIKTKPIYVKC